MKSERAGPITPSKSTDRILDIDILRGFALFGVILVNVFYFHVPAAYFSTYYEQFTDLYNKSVFMRSIGFLLENFIQSSHSCLDWGFRSSF